MNKAEAYDNLISIIEKWEAVCHEEIQMSIDVNMPNNIDMITARKREARLKQVQYIKREHAQYIKEVKRQAEMPKQIKAKGWDIKNDMRMPH